MGMVNQNKLVSIGSLQTIWKKFSIRDQILGINIIRKQVVYKWLLDDTQFCLTIWFLRMWVSRIQTPLISLSLSVICFHKNFSGDLIIRIYTIYGTPFFLFCCCSISLVDISLPNVLNFPTDLIWRNYFVVYLFLYLSFTNSTLIVLFVDDSTPLSVMSVTFHCYRDWTSSLSLYPSRRSQLLLSSPRPDSTPSMIFPKPKWHSPPKRWPKTRY